MRYYYDLSYIPSEDKFVYKVYVNGKYLATIETKTRKEGDVAIKKSFPNAVLRNIKLK